MGHFSGFLTGFCRERLGASLVASALLWGCGGSVEPLPEDLGESRVVGALGSVQAQDFLPPEPTSPGGIWCEDEENAQGRGRIRLEREALAGVSLYQGVEIPLSDTEPHQIDVVAGREALVRVFVAPGFLVHGARMIATDASGAEFVVEEERVIGTASTQAALESTYNFVLPGSVIGTSTGIRVELFSRADCATARQPKWPAVFPAGDVPYPLAAREVGPIEVVLVPIRYDADESGRLPDFSEEHLTILRDHLYAMYPVKNVLLTVREAVATSETTMEGILSQMLHLRSLEQPPSNVAYFGMVNPAPSMAEYCVGSCVAGVSAVGSASGEASAGVGIGFRGPAQETFLHELGHMNRLDHAPCGNPSSPDEFYPHQDAKLGSWGFDIRNFRLLDPASHSRDFMSYCDPTWISDHNFQKLIDRLALVNALPRADIVTRPENEWQGLDAGARGEEPRIVSCSHEAH